MVSTHKHDEELVIAALNATRYCWGNHIV